MPSEKTRSFCPCSRALNRIGKGLKAYCISPALEVPTCTARRTPRLQQSERPLAGKGRNCGREMAGNFADKWRVSRHLKGTFTCRSFATRDRRLYFPSEGRNVEDFFALKNPTASAGFEPANLGTNGQHATCTECYRSRL
jgi:hypothetical protein